MYHIMFPPLSTILSKTSTEERLPNQKFPTCGNSNPSVALRTPCVPHSQSCNIAAGFRERNWPYLCGRGNSASSDANPRCAVCYLKTIPSPATFGRQGYSSNVYNGLDPTSGQGRMSKRDQWEARANKTAYTVG